MSEPPSVAVGPGAGEGRTGRAIVTPSLITGGAGFLGRHLAELLLRSGGEVTVLDPVPPPEDLPSGLRHVSASVTDAPAVRDAIAGVRYVFHMAGTPDLWAPRRSEAYRVHREGTRTVLEEAARVGGVRVVHTSTEAILRDFDRSRLQGWRRSLFFFFARAREPSSRLEAVSLAVSAGGSSGPWLPEPREVPAGYCRAKVRSERLALEAAERGQDVVVVSPVAVLGPGDRNLTPPTRMLRGFVQGRFPAYLDGWIRLADVRDVAAAHAEAAKRGVSGRRYVVGAPDQPMSRFLADLERQTGRRMPRRRVPPAVALGSAYVAELTAELLTGRSPNATVAGVRIALAPSRAGVEDDGSRLGPPPRDRSETIADTIAWLRREGLVSASRGAVR